MKLASLVLRLAQLSPSSAPACLFKKLSLILFYFNKIVCEVWQKYNIEVDTKENKTLFELSEVLTSCFYMILKNKFLFS